MESQSNASGAPNVNEEYGASQMCQTAAPGLFEINAVITVLFTNLETDAAIM
jgi:hypothetical protein